MGTRIRSMRARVLRWRPILFIGAVAALMPSLAEAQYAQRFTSITNGAVTFTGNALGLDGETNQNGQGTRGAIGTFISTDTSLQDTTPSPATAPLFPPGTTSDWRLNG